MASSNVPGGGIGGEGRDGGLFARLVSATVACLFNCFRFRDSLPRLVSQPSLSSETVAEERNPLLSVLISEEGDHDNSQSKEKEIKQLESATLSEFDVKELNHEANFLKACGTLAETPTEIQIISMECKGLSEQQEEPENAKFRSWLTDKSTEISSENQQFPLPATPIEELINETVSLQQTHNSCMINTQNGGGISAFSSGDTSRIQNVIAPTEVQATQDYGSSSIDLAPSVQRKTKYVRFDCDSNSSDIACENPKGSEGVVGPRASSKQSPYSTPVKLSDEMQTPGTVFPAYPDDTGNQKRTRIRSQYVCSVLNPVEKVWQLKDLQGDYADTDNPSGQVDKSLEQIDEASSISGNGMREASSWPKMKSCISDEKENRNSNLLNFGESSSPAERPIIGMVSAYWNDEEGTCCISPKLQDGNGIPNTTNKYKEDQKVRWHTTPFEERLEKALSNKKSFT